MNISGILNLSHDKNDYIMFYSGRNINLTEMLNTMLFEDIMIKIKNAYSGKELFHNEGKLIKNKVSKCFYLFHVNNSNLDEILWNNVGNRLNIEMKNTTKDSV